MFVSNPSVTTQVRRKIEAWRDALIETSRRNPLISLPKSAIHLLGSVTPTDIWKLPTFGKRGGYYFIPDSDTTAKYSYFQKANVEEIRRLNNIRLKARLSLSEHGINVLFVTLGTLEWTDPKDGKTLRSPLILLPVELTRLPALQGFVLHRLEDEAVLNPTLQYRLRQADVAFDLSSWEEDVSPSDYLVNLETAVASRGWSVIKNECNLGRFSYLNLRMYEDVSSNIERLQDNPLVRALAGDTIALQQLPAPSIPEARELDLLSPSNTYHVLPADPSQEEAVIAAREGQSFVLQGPPGTGKTQTIANIIAACIADGRKVLFVSEKMAALEAVYKRLCQHELDDFCLEAHSHKANKLDILKQLRAAKRALQNPIPPYEMDFDAWESQRNELNNHAVAVHSPMTSLARTVYAVRGALCGVRDAPDIPLEWTNIQKIDAAGFRLREGLAERLRGFDYFFANANSHPWLSLKPNVQYSTAMQAQLTTLLDNLLRFADEMPMEVNELRLLCGFPGLNEDAISPEEMRRITIVSDLLETTPKPLPEWVQADDSETKELRNIAAATQERYQNFVGRRAKLLMQWKETVFDLPQTDFIERLSTRNADVLAPALGQEWADHTPEKYTHIESLLRAVENATLTLQRGSTRLCGLCSLPTSETLANAQHIAEIATLVIADPRPQPAWFKPEGLAYVRSLARMAQQNHSIVQRVRTMLDSIFTTDLYALDLEGLEDRFTRNHVGFFRYFRPYYYRDLKTLRQCLQPGQVLKGRTITTDLAAARQCRDAEGELKAQSALLHDVFKGHYRGEETDWVALGTAFAKIETLTTHLGGAIPNDLRLRLIMSGIAVREVRDQYPLLVDQIQRYEETLNDAAQHIAFPEADTVPLTQQKFETLSAWCADIQTRLADVRTARETLRAERLTWPIVTAHLLSELTDVCELRREEQRIAQEASELKARFATFFNGLNTDWDTVIGTLEWIDRFRRAFHVLGTPPSDETITIASTGEPSILKAIKDKSTVLQNKAASSTATCQILEIWLRSENRAEMKGLYALRESCYVELREYAENRMAVLEDLERWIEFCNLRMEFEFLGINGFCDEVIQRDLSQETIVPAFQKWFYSRWLENVIADVPPLKKFDHTVLNSRRSKFVALEQTLLQVNPYRVRDNTKQRRQLTATANVGEAATLNHYLGQTRPRASVRKILGEIPNVLGRLTPCLLMSPLSVSLFLDPDKIQFDVVIFDEASQVFVHSALGSLLRAPQVIIAGDTQQLPPTAFFRSLSDDGDSDEDDEGESDTTENPTSETLEEPTNISPRRSANAFEFDSILSAASAVTTEDNPHFPERYLTWHYRSRHESLIAFSRQHFYQRLETFPSAALPSALELVYLTEGRYLGGKDEKGRSRPRINPIEAAEVVARAVKQLESEPKLSLGIITMSEAQQNAILAEIDRVRLSASEMLLKLLNEEPTEERPEPLFVKNIENVQGDERDIIFLSIGYGPYPDGKIYQRFGPINREGGQKRLNVAITRARAKCITFSSLLPNQILISDATREGPRRLRQYLEQAYSTQSEAHTTVSIASSPAMLERDLLIESVAVTLRNRGHLVHEQVGLFQYRVDLAIVDPNDEQRYLLGIECDGTNYYSGPTARSRELLRTDVLAGLGWRITRVWSADWIRSPEAVIAQVEAEIQRAKNGEPFTLIARATVAPIVLPTALSPSLTETATPKNVTFPQTPESELLPGMTYFQWAEPNPFPQGTLYGEGVTNGENRRRRVLDLVKAEGPVHIGRVPEYLTECAGLQRAGKNIQKIADSAIKVLVTSGQIIQMSSTFLALSRDDIPARVPKPGDVMRSAEQVSHEEIAAIILCRLRSASGMRQDKVITETARLMGYERTGEQVRERIQAALAGLEVDGKVLNRGGQIDIIE
jgi:very-short-patch-repair endonuclease